MVNFPVTAGGLSIKTLQSSRTFRHVTELITMADLAAFAFYQLFIKYIHLIVEKTAQLFCGAPLNFDFVLTQYWIAILNPIWFYVEVGLTAVTLITTPITMYDGSTHYELGVTWQR